MHSIGKNLAGKLETKWFTVKIYQNNDIMGSYDFVFKDETNILRDGMLLLVGYLVYSSRDKSVENTFEFMLPVDDNELFRAILTYVAKLEKTFKDRLDELHRPFLAVHDGGKRRRLLG